MSTFVDPKFWENKKVFLTGHTGFKGSWLSLWLSSMGACVKGYSLEPPTSPSLFEQARIAELLEHELGDIRDGENLSKSMQNFSPDIVIHMAAQPLVRYSYKAPVETYTTNVIGTVNLFEAVRSVPSVKAVVNVTTDKCYANREWVWGYREDEAMGGHDPYSSSKGCAELVTSAYRSSYFNRNSSVKLASARAGNVIGGGDWAEDRLIPDILRAFSNNEPVIVRNPTATRPWQHVLEPLAGYLILAQSLYEEKGAEFSEGWNFGPEDKDVQPVSWILDRMVYLWGEDARWILDSTDQPHEAQLLKLDVSKANTRLDWRPRWNLGEALEKIIEWHKAWMSGKDVREMSLAQIQNYQDSAKGY